MKSERHTFASNPELTLALKIRAQAEGKTLSHIIEATLMEAFGIYGQGATHRRPETQPNDIVDNDPPYPQTMEDVESNPHRSTTQYAILLLAGKWKDRALTDAERVRVKELGDMFATNKGRVMT